MLGIPFTYHARRYWFHFRLFLFIVCVPGLVALHARHSKNIYVIIMHHRNLVSFL